MSSLQLDKSMKGEVKEDRDNILSSIQQQGKRQWAQTDIEKNTLKHKTPTYCSIREVKHWNRLPKEIVESPSVEIIPPGQHTQQPALVRPVLSRSAGLDDLQVSLPTSTIL